MKKTVFLICIVSLGFLLRFYKLSDFPVQLNHDEVSQLYDAISIAQTHKDIYGNFMPFIFPSVQDFKPPFYTYITALFYLFFGGGELTIRLPGAIFGVLIIIAVYFFTLKLLKNWQIAILASFITAITPFEIFFSRKSFENQVGIFFMLLAFTLLLSFSKAKERTRSLYLAAIFFGIAIYTYFSHAIIIPLILTAFIFIYRRIFFGSLRTVLTALIIFLLFFIPLMVITITNPGARFRSQTVFITQDPNLGRAIQYSAFSNLLINFIYKEKAIFDHGFDRLLKQFDIKYVFANGLDFTNQGLLGIGPLLFIQLPFLILGLIYLVRLKDFLREKKFILAWILIGMLPSGLTFEEHSPHRSIMVFTMLDIVSAAGLFYGMGLLRFSIQKKVAAGLLLLLFLANYLYFIHMYVVNFPSEKSQEIHYPFKQVALFAWSQHEKFSQIIFDPVFGETAPVVGTAAHYYFAYFGNYPPARFQKEFRKGLKPREVLFDKISIRKIDWREDQYLKNVLIIGNKWSLPVDSIDKSRIIKTFDFYDGSPAFYAIKL